jgi:hypothetical protein
MAGVHATGGSALLFLSAAFVVLALACIRLPSWERALTAFRTVLVALLAAQVVVGGLLYFQGRRPGDSLHLVYGLVALLVLPGATSFAKEAPPQARAGVLALAGLVVCGLVWRLMATGASS